jgi:GNAT superfamily N-acetyltransferase
MSEDRHLTIGLSWSSESYISDCINPDRFVYEMSGNLFGIDDTERRKLVGKFRVYYVDVMRAIDAGEPIIYVLDAHSPNVAEYFGPIFGSATPDFSHHLLETLDYDILGGNLLILDRLEILPQYRGKGIGLRALRHMIEHFSPGAAVVAMKPFPLQFEIASSDTEKRWRAMLELDQLPMDKDVATEKLRRHYSKLGFLRLRSTPMMVMSTTWVLPTLEEA